MEQSFENLTPLVVQITEKLRVINPIVSKLADQSLDTKFNPDKVNYCDGFIKQPPTEVGGFMQRRVAGCPLKVG